MTYPRSHRHQGSSSRPWGLQALLLQGDCFPLSQPGPSDSHLPPSGMRAHRSSASPQQGNAGPTLVLDSRHHTHTHTHAHTRLLVRSGREARECTQAEGTDPTSAPDVFLECGQAGRP